MGDLGAGLVSGVQRPLSLASPRELSSPTGLSQKGRRQAAVCGDGHGALGGVVALDEGVAQWVANRSPKLAPFVVLFEGPDRGRAVPA